MNVFHDLVFLDSFSHDNSEDLNLDLVQFSSAVVVHEVRIIPNGFKVLVDSPVKIKHGTTIPSSFKVEFYVNNLNKPNASTFEKIGILDYQENGEFVLKCEYKKPTDGLIIKGWYQTITLAIYGSVTAINQDLSPPPPPPTAQRSKPQSVLPTGFNTNIESTSVASSAYQDKPLNDVPNKYPAVSQDIQSNNPKDIPLEHKGAVRDPRDNQDRVENIFKTPEKKDKLSRKNRKREMLSDSTGVHKKNRSSSPNIYFDDEEGDMTEPGEIAEGVDVIDENMDIYGALSDGEIPENDGEYSQVSSDDINLQYANCLPQEVELGDWEGVDDGAWTYGSISSFNPYQCELALLETFTDPSLTDFEKEKLVVMSNAESNDGANLPPSSVQLLDIIKHLRLEITQDKFVESVELLPTLLVPGLVHISLQKKWREDVEYLIDWTCDSLQCAFQPSTSSSFSIHYLKTAIRLVGCLCACDAHIASVMMEKDVQHRLLDVYTNVCTSVPLQSLVLTSLDQSIRLKEGLCAFIGKLTNYTNKKTKPHPCTPYQRMVEILIKKQRCGSSNVAMSLQYLHYQRKFLSLKIQSILKKVHMFEVFTKLHDNVHSLLNKISIVELNNASENIGTHQGIPNEQSTDMNKTITHSQESNNIVDEALRIAKTDNEEINDEVMMIVACLDEVFTVLQNIHSLAQPERMMKFEKKRTLSYLFALFHIFNTCNLMECIFVLLSSPVTNNNPTIFMSIKNVLTSLTISHHGLLFLTSKLEATNGIIRILLQTSDYCQDDDRELNAANQLGLFMVYHLQTMQYIDQLNEYHKRASLCDDQDVNDTAILAVMLNLYSMTFTFQGKEALVRVFTSNENINTLMSFIHLEADENKRPHSPVCISYVLSIILIIIQHTYEVDWLLKHGKTLLIVVEQEMKSGKADDQVKELHDWLSPMKIITSSSSSSHEHLSLELLTMLRQHVDDMHDMPSKSVVSILRILKHLTIPSNQHDEADKLRMIQYKLVLTNLFGANCLSLYGNILLKMKNLLLLSWQQGFSQTPTGKCLVLSVVEPVLMMMRSMLSLLISIRGNQFKDLTSLPGLFAIHTVMCSTSQTGVLPPELQRVQNLIVDILMAFTQPILMVQLTDGDKPKMLWSDMIGEVMKYTLSLPCTFLSGLILISELLPLPLPLQVKQDLTVKQMDEVLMMRKRWAINLLPHSVSIQQIIRIISATTVQPLIQLLRRVCWQLADLSAPTALIIVSALLDTLQESLDVSTNANQSNKTSAMLSTNVHDNDNNKNTTSSLKQEPPASPRTFRILNLISFLVSQPVVKAAFLSVLKSCDSEKKFEDIMQRMSSLLKVVSDQSAHIQAQEAIVTIFQSICDFENCLISEHEGNKHQLSNSLPSKDHMSLICLSLLHHINNRDQKFSTILLSLRTLSLLVDHDYGFFFVKQAMEQVSTAFVNLFKQINATFSKDSSDCIATLSSAADFIQFLTILPSTQLEQEHNHNNNDNDNNGFNDEEVAENKNASEDKNNEDQVFKTLRTYTMSYNEVRNVLGWTSSESTDDDGLLNHPLNDLDVLLCEYAKDEDGLKTVYEGVHILINILKSSDHIKTRPDVVELVLPESDALMVQMGRRVLYNITDDDDDRLTTTYWLSTPMGDDFDHDPELVKCDLIQMAEKYCPGFDLEAELKKGSFTDSSILPKQTKRLLISRKSTDTINTSKMRGGGSAFVAPLRGRGFIRGGMGGGVNRGDVFRSRPPNTSRPPSMHVDDFVKLETQTHQPANNTNTNVVPISLDHMARRPEEMIRLRGDTFDRGVARFLGNTRWPFHPFTSRDDAAALMLRGAYRGMGVMNRGGVMMRGTATNLINRTSPSKGLWSIRRSSYSGVAGFPRSGSDVGDRRSLTYAYVSNPGVIWHEHKERTQEHRVDVPIETFTMWRERLHHQKSIR